MRHDAPFRHSLPVPDGLFRAPLYVTGAGWERIMPGQSYPRPDAAMYGFRWEDGRVLPEFCLSLLTQGSGHLETQAGGQEIPERRAFLFRPGEWHRHRPARASGWTNHWIHFNGDLPHEWMRDGAFELDGNLPIIEDAELFHGQFMRLLLTVERAPTTNTRALACQAVGLISHFLLHTAPLRDECLHHEDDLINRAVEFIWNHSHVSVGVPEVASHVGCVRRTLERRFAAVLGRSVLDEIQLCRLTRAKWLLEETALPLKQILSRAGLRERRQLWLLFKKHLAMSPDAYRRSVQPGA
ncbi:MAG: AraC family transcriptional regulator [Verrucomicrobia bacterium]|nr:AraC family transcriptional regulator [Verrucomicrobiota bacterium]